MIAEFYEYNQFRVHVIVLKMIFDLTFSVQYVYIRAFHRKPTLET